MPRKYSNSVKIYYPEFSREEIIRKLSVGVRELAREIPIKTAILFGSYATGYYTAASDIDLFIVVDSEKTGKDEAYRRIQDRLKLPNLQLHLYSLREYQELKRKNSGFLKEVSRGFKILKEES